MSKARVLVAEVFLALLLNVTAGLLNRPDAILVSKWGWLLRQANLLGHRDDSVFLIARGRAKACQNLPPVRFPVT